MLPSGIIQEIGFENTGLETHGIRYGGTEQIVRLVKDLSSYGQSVGIGDTHAVYVSR